MTQPEFSPPLLVLDSDQLDRLLSGAWEALRRHLASLPDLPARGLEPTDEQQRRILETLRAPLPEEGSDGVGLIRRVVEDLTQPSFTTPGPGYMAFIPGGGLPEAGIADLVANVLNRYVPLWEAAPGLAALETSVIRWFSALVGLGADAGGFLTSGGSLANFSALYTARREKLPEDFLAGRVYVSEEVHHSVLRAARLVGLPADRVIKVGTEAGSFRLCPRQLRAKIAEDRRAGGLPFCVVASAGSTNTGTVDPMAELAEVCRGEGLWFHVDAAYGGFFALTDRGRRALAGIELADSVTLDPHKGLFLPYGTGCLLVRDGDALRRAHAIDADYMPPFQAGGDEVDFCNISPELSRDFRGLRVWLPLALHGARSFRAALDQKMDLARWAEARLREIEGLEIVTEARLSLVVFRWRGPGGLSRDGAESDLWNRRLLDQVNARQRAFITGTTVPLAGRRSFVCRICILGFRTGFEQVSQLVEDIRRSLEELSAEGSAGAPAPS